MYKSNRSVACGFCIFLGMLPALASCQTEYEDAEMRKTAQHYIDAFRAGNHPEIGASATGLVLNGTIERTSIILLAKELKSGSANVREHVVALLENIGLELDGASTGTNPVIRDKAVIRALLVEGFAKNDSAASSAELILREKCMPNDLAMFSDIYAASLQARHGEYLYLIAKAKAVHLKPMVDELAMLPAWQKDAELHRMIALVQAALGDARIEDEFIDATTRAEKNAPPAPANRFYNVSQSKDGKELASRLYMLGLIGTKKTLRAICAYLRSPIKTYVPNIKERSIRWDALDAIRYNFPDERLLSDPESVGEWSAVEQFCIIKFGAVFDGPTPEFERDRPYPTRFNKMR